MRMHFTHHVLDEVILHIIESGFKDRWITFIETALDLDIPQDSLSVIKYKTPQQLQEEFGFNLETEKKKKYPDVHT